MSQNKAKKKKKDKEINQSNVSGEKYRNTYSRENIGFSKLIKGMLIYLNDPL